MLKHDDNAMRIMRASRKFPTTFHLRGHDGLFRVGPGSYVNDDDVVMLYTQRKCEDQVWRDFAKATVEELSGQIVTCVFEPYSIPVGYGFCVKCGRPRSEHSE